MIYHAQAPNGELRVVGQTVDGEFRKRVHRSKHFLHTPPAIAIEAEVFDKMDAEEFISLIRVKDEELLEYLETPFDTFKKYKFTVERGGFGKQYALTLEWWDVKDSTGLLLKARRMQQEEKVNSAADQSARCDALIRQGFKPEMYNMEHKALADKIGKLYRFRKYKTPPKGDIDRLEKSIISFLERYGKERAETPGDSA